MATDLQLAVDLIQAKLRTLHPTYLSLVPDSEHYPTSLDDSLCPFALTWVEDGSWYQKGAGYKIDDRSFSIFVFIESLAQRDVTTRYPQGLQVLAAVRNLFATASHIQLDDGSVSGFQITATSKTDSPQSDSGLVSNLPFGGKPWFGFTIPLRVRIQWIA